jgi:prepilin-type N-terminal cleavage/methylation domain-containing protein
MRSREKPIAGFTLVEVLVSVGILGIGAYFVATQIGTMKSAMGHAMIRSEISMVRESIYRSVNCLQTLRTYFQNDGTVHCSGTLSLKDLNGAQLPNILKNWQLDSQCSDTGITIKIRRQVGGQSALDPLTNTALDYNNTTINPLFGRGSESGLCDAWFHNNSRIKVITAGHSQLHFNATDCSDINPASPPAQYGGAPGTQGMASYTATFTRANQMDAKCSVFCQQDPNYFVGGNVVDCTNSEVTCVCYR